jgi:hypothetical protein
MTDAHHAPVIDRRHTERHPARLTGKVFLPGKAVALDCIITNLSAGGAGFWCAEPPALQTPLVLYVEGFGRFDGLATRNDHGEIGMTFHDAECKQLGEALAAFVTEGMTSVTRVRRHERIKGGGSLDHFSLPGGEQVPCTVLDISLQGALLRASQRPAIGEVLHLGKTRAWVVRHHGDDGIGVQFLQPAAAE